MGGRRYVTVGKGNKGYNRRECLDSTALENWVIFLVYLVNSEVCLDALPSQIPIFWDIQGFLWARIGGKHMGSALVSTPGTIWRRIGRECVVLTYWNIRISTLHLHYHMSLEPLIAVNVKLLKCHRLILYKIKDHVMLIYNISRALFPAIDTSTSWRSANVNKNFWEYYLLKQMTIYIMIIIL